MNLKSGIHLSGTSWKLNHHSFIAYFKEIKWVSKAFWDRLKIIHYAKLVDFSSDYLDLYIRSIRTCNSAITIARSCSGSGELLWEYDMTILLCPNFCLCSWDIANCASCWLLTLIFAIGIPSVCGITLRLKI